MIQNIIFLIIYDIFIDVNLFHILTLKCAADITKSRLFVSKKNSVILDGLIAGRYNYLEPASL